MTVPGHSDKYVTIATYIGAWEAHLARAKLESEGIYSLVLDDQTASINWIYSSDTRRCETASKRRRQQKSNSSIGENFGG